MGRPPCRDQNGLKKGPWTPEEDIALVSYIQQHGPGNWRSVPANTATVHNCAMRQRWAAIASYLPQRTDNDIKNYWNSHLKKKLKKLGHGLDGQTDGRDGSTGGSHASISRGQWERRLQTDIHMAKQALCDALSVDSKPVNGFNCFNQKPVLLHQGSAIGNYASSTGNISRLLEGWTKERPNWARNEPRTTTANHGGYPANIVVNSSCSSEDHDSNAFSNSFSFCSSSDTLQSELEDTNNNLAHGYLTSLDFQEGGSHQAPAGFPGGAEEVPPFRVFEKWLLDDGGPATPGLDGLL
ncbi:hypothetical protein SAY86_010068 [Trapa natans]|uniref:Uncharacterized protein n=1 Tax=Trapa natans TaxID=22666 RepID=A0AAN7L2V2_TRANT|nr:hypothetical protein SAY86_010068 [Trapa natans]